MNPEPEPEPVAKPIDQLFHAPGAKTASAVIFPSRFASPGTALDAEVYRQLLDDVAAGPCHGPVHLMPGSGLQPQERPPQSPLTLHIETLQPDNLLPSDQVDNSLHAWMVNPEVGYPDCLPDAALSRIDVVLCKSQAAVGLMQAYKAQHAQVARYRIFYTGHTSTDLRPTNSANTGNLLPEVVFRSRKTGTYMYLINPAVERDEVDGGSLVVIYRLTAVEVAMETCHQRRRYMRENTSSIVVMDTCEVDGLDEYLASFADPTRCSCLLRWRPQGTCASVRPEFELLLPFTPLPEPDDLLGTSRNTMYGFEDPRLFRFRSRLWVICGFLGSRLSFVSSTAADAALKDELQNYRQHLVIFPLDSSSAQDQKSSAVLLHYDGRHSVEKNWMPFEHRGELFIVYSVSPHVILAVDTETGLCTEIYATHPPDDYEVLEQGEPGNGVPPMQVTISSGETLMIGAAHIRRMPRGGQWAGLESVGRRAVRKTFFYAFEAVPPFRIRSVGPLRTLMLSQQQHVHAVSVDPSALAEPLVEFLSGMCVDPVKQEVLLAFGVDDTFACTKNWPLKKLLSDLGLQENTCQLPRQMACFNSVREEGNGAGMDYSLALHVGGKSQWKNTEAVLRCWVSDCSRNQMLPPLTVVAWGPLLERLRRCFPDWPWPHADGKQQVSLPNVTILTEKLQQKDLQHHMATCGVHVCPSACEGFGHIINEARSLGAVIVTTAAQPMNELVADGLDGFTVPVTHCTGVTTNVLGAHMYEIEGQDDPTVSGLVNAMSRVLALGEYGCRRMGMLARLRFERERRSFEDALRAFGKAAVEHGRTILSMSDHGWVQFEPDDWEHRASVTSDTTGARSAEQVTWVDYLREQHVNQNVQGRYATRQHTCTTSVNSTNDWDGLPARLLEVEPDHYVLDLCAGANGGQSCFELLRMMHCSNISRSQGTANDEVQTCSEYIPNGVLIANDLDLRRLSAFVDLARKQLPLLCAPLLATRCDAANFPTLQCADTRAGAHIDEQECAQEMEPALKPQAGQQGPRQYKQKFDRILCCPPSSSSCISAALTLHTTQLAILRRGLELLSSGGVLVYAVRTLDPVQGEAVVVAAVRSLRALPEWGQHGIEFLSVNVKIALASATTIAAAGTCATVLSEEAQEQAGRESDTGALQCQPALDDWSVPHPNYAGPASTMPGGAKYESDAVAPAEGAHVLYRSFDDVPKELRRSGSGSQSSSSSSMTPQGLIKSTAFPPNFFGCSAADDALLKEMKKHCIRAGDRFFAILRKRKQQEIQQIDNVGSKDSSVIGSSGNDGEDPDTKPGDLFEPGVEVEVITPQGQRWPAVVKGRGKGKKYKGLVQVVFPDGCSFHCDPTQLVFRHQRQPELEDPAPPTSIEHEGTHVSKQSHHEGQNQKIFKRKVRRERVVARRPGLQMFEQVDISGAQSIWRELCHTYGFKLHDDAEEETAKDQCLRRQRFPGEALCIARYHKGKGILHLLSPAIVSLRFRTNCRVVTAGIPCFSRVTRVLADVNAHECTSSRSVHSWYWRPCHEAIGLIARCCADGATGVLRISVPQFIELLRERLLPRSALHEVDVVQSTAITSDSKVVAEKGHGGSHDISTTYQQPFNRVGLPATCSVVVIPLAHSSDGSGRQSLLLPLGDAYESTTAAGVAAMAVCGDLTMTRLTISTSAKTRASFAQILRLSELGQRSNEEVGACVPR